MTELAERVESAIAIIGRETDEVCLRAGNADTPERRRRGTGEDKSDGEGASPETATTRRSEREILPRVEGRLTRTEPPDWEEEATVLTRDHIFVAG